VDCCRYILKEGKHWSNRDSKIGLRCAGETCKFRLNAMSRSSLLRHLFVIANAHCHLFRCVMSPFAAIESQPSVRKRTANTTWPTSGGETGSTKNIRRNEIILIFFIITSIIVLCITVPPSAFMEVGPKWLNLITFNFRPIGTPANSSCAFYESGLIKRSSRIFSMQTFGPIMIKNSTIY